jgi:hypothetical protein
MSTNKTEPTPNLKRKTKVKIKVRDAGEVMDYEAVVRRSNGEVIEINGSTSTSSGRSWRWANT